jgi:tetratricopeptide (TPR) repeat protein
MAAHARGRLDEAAAFYERALATWKTALGEKHPSTAIAQASLGSLYCDRGWYARAEPLLAAALSTRERVLGPDHPKTAASVTMLGGLYLLSGRASEAEKQLERAWAAFQAAGSEASPDGVKTLHNLASSEFRQGAYDRRKYGEAEQHLRKLVELRERTTGLGSLALAAALDSLSRTCVEMKNYREAERAEGRALAIRRTALGPQHPDTVASFHRYTSLHNRR